MLGASFCGAHGSCERPSHQAFVAALPTDYDLRPRDGGSMPRRTQRISWKVRRPRPRHNTILVQKGDYDAASLLIRICDTGSIPWATTYPAIGQGHAMVGNGSLNVVSHHGNAVGENPTGGMHPARTRKPDTEWHCSLPGRAPITQTHYYLP